MEIAPRKKTSFRYLHLNYIFPRSGIYHTVLSRGRCQTEDSTLLPRISNHLKSAYKYIRSWVDIRKGFPKDADILMMNGESWGKNVSFLEGTLHRGQLAKKRLKPVKLNAGTPEGCIMGEQSRKQSKGMQGTGSSMSQA